ncbi:hypothetical protein [Streptomyces sp. NPDC012825]|uniref:hypothetical protein n=1 Tax=Streptomyces sp. NPDC012825 TaxID=3364851 RepID=UPI0036953766
MPGADGAPSAPGTGCLPVSRSPGDRKAPGNRSWQGDAPVPTLEGQCVIKNIVLVAACLVVAADECGRTAPA